MGVMKITCQKEKWHQHFINKNGFLEPKKYAKDERSNDLKLFQKKKNWRNYLQNRA